MTGRKVKTAFTDRHTGYSYAVGDVYTGSETRIAELEGSGHLTKTDVTVPEGGDNGESGDTASGKPADRRTTRKR
ncbi:hypothetical protein [Deinococcus navajonensis]|uniref:Uncharacterized protein n=1 Tax=Deinococcus navajonensis TaxID=309884 RepID=A0ABV8XMR7_9DEIO